MKKQDKPPVIEKKRPVVGGSLNVNETMKCPKCGLVVVNDGFDWFCSNELCGWEQGGDLI